MNRVHQPSEELPVAFNRLFESRAEKYELGSGSAIYIVRSSSELPGIDTFLSEWVPDWQDEYITSAECLATFGVQSAETLVSYSVEGGAPTSWFTSLDAFRLHDRGYISMNLSDVEYEPAEPVLAAWEPYESQQTFEACFIELHRRAFDILRPGTVHSRGQRVSRSLLHSALVQAVGNDADFRRRLIDFTESSPDQSSSLDPDLSVQRYLDQTERETI